MDTNQILLGCLKEALEESREKMKKIDEHEIVSYQKECVYGAIYSLQMAVEFFLKQSEVEEELKKKRERYFAK